MMHSVNYVAGDLVIMACPTQDITLDLGLVIDVNNCSNEVNVMWGNHGDPYCDWSEFNSLKKANHD